MYCVNVRIVITFTPLHPCGTHQGNCFCVVYTHRRKFSDFFFFTQNAHTHTTNSDKKKSLLKDQKLWMKKQPKFVKNTTKVCTRTWLTRESTRMCQSPLCSVISDLFLLQSLKWRKKQGKHVLPNLYVPNDYNHLYCVLFVCLHVVHLCKDAVCV